MFVMGHDGKNCWDIDGFGALLDVFVNGAWWEQLLGYRWLRSSHRYVC
jgi:hypothetical protein